MLVDEVEITIQAGKGGPGRVSFYSKSGAGPNGGDGGKGGDVYMKVISDLYALGKFLSHPECKAENGQPGGNNTKTGADGKNLVLTVPIGTSLIDQEGKEVELNELNEQILLAKGGLGGKGNFFFKSSSNTTPRYAQPGLPGEKKRLTLKLKLIADFGLIGLPNAGKSSLLNELTNAQAKTGDYPFTTLEPNLGMLNGKVIADIPGLIEGASEGKGLGHKFLKHIEKVKLLLHCISSQSQNPLRDYKVIRGELKKFNPKLLEKQEVILLTKSDLVEEKFIFRENTSQLCCGDEHENQTRPQGYSAVYCGVVYLEKKIIPISIHNWDSLQILIQTLAKS